MDFDFDASDPATLSTVLKFLCDRLLNDDNAADLQKALANPVTPMARDACLRSLRTDQREPLMALDGKARNSALDAIVTSRRAARAPETADSRTRRLEVFPHSDRLKRV